MQQPELRYQLLAENASDVVALVGADLTYLWVSPSVTTILGWQPDQVIGHSPQDFVHPDDFAGITAAHELVTDGPVVVRPMQILCADGTYRWMAGRSRSVLIGEGELGEVVSMRDVHDEVLAHQALEASEARYRFLTDNSADVVIRGTTDGVFEWVSPPVTALLGWQPEELIGRPFIDLVHPDDRARVIPLQAELTAGIPNSFQIRLQMKAGGYRWVGARARPVLDDAGNVVARVASWSDAEAEAEAREALEASERRYRLLAKYGSDIVCLSGPDRRLQWVSPTVLPTLGWTPEELVGTMLSELIHPDDLGATNEHRELLYAPDHPSQPISYLLRARTKHGEYRWMSGRATPELDDDGRLLSVVSGLHDVNELVIMRQEAERNAELVRVVLDASRDGMMRFDRDATVLYVNNEIARLSGRPAGEWKGHSLREMGYSETDATNLESHVLQVFKEGNSHTWLLDTDTADGTRFFEAIMAPVHGADGSVLEVLATSRDVTDRERSAQQLMARASHDPLTGLANRPMLQSELSRALAATRRSGRPTAVLMIDLDHFKTINDSLGHSEGDAVLIAAAKRLEASVRGGDLVARLGGDEFVIVMRDLDDPAGAMALASRINQRFRDPLTTDAAVALTTASIGVALATPGMDEGTVLREADRALYAAKDAGRDTAVLFGPATVDPATVDA